MKTRANIAIQLKSVRLAFAALLFLFILNVARPAAAQGTWTENNAYQAWAAFRDYFYTPGHSAGNIIADEKFNAETPKWTVFWEEAEDIEVVEDAYYWSLKNDGENSSQYVTDINNLANGFIFNMFPTTNFGPPGCGSTTNPCNLLDWSGDDFNDDLIWASVAFARAYQITGNPNWLTAAENQFNFVWANAQAGNGGLMQSMYHELPSDQPWTPNLNSAVNFNFVVAGYLIYDNTHDQSYKNRADTVYNWAITNLFTTNVPHPVGPCDPNSDPAKFVHVTCAKIYDANNTGTLCSADSKFCNDHVYTGGSISPSDYTYNYGVAIQAAVRYGDYDKAQYIANYLMYNMDNPCYPYSGTTPDGFTIVPYTGPIANYYNILPKYGATSDCKDATKDNAGNGTNNAGLNGIALRAVGLGLYRQTPTGQAILDSTTLHWAQANLQAAWNIKNTDNVMWNDWVETVDSVADKNPTQSAYIYHSWDCTNAVAGMLDIKAPN